MSTSPDVFTRVPPSTNERRSLLTPLESARGVLAMHRNGRRLFADGMLLFEESRFPGAAMFAVLAQEEFGKAVNMGFHAVIDEEGGQKQLWKRAYESHRQKNFHSLTVGIVTGHLRIADNAQSSDPVQDAAREYLRVRERATYVDCVSGPECWSLPSVAFGRSDSLATLGRVFAAVRKLFMPSEAIGQIGKVWAEALEGLPSPTLSQQGELTRCHDAIEWAKSREAQRLDEVDHEEALEWTRKMRERLTALESGQ